MDGNVFRNICGCIVSVTHLAGIGMLATSHRFLDPTEHVSTVLIVAPITLVYVIAFLKWTIDGVGKPVVVEHVPAVAAGVLIGAVSVFCFSLLFLVVSFTVFGRYDVQGFQLWVSCCEASFGALIGLVFERFFGVKYVTATPTGAQNARKSR